MSRTVKVAAIQMDAAPAPLKERLQRATDLIAKAVGDGAQLVVLPELFNTGYEYHDRNYDLAETPGGETGTWMKKQAKQHNIHLVGTLMLKDELDVYNRALLFAPDGRCWQYDKNYPFLWERSYFKERQNTTIAHTDLGKFGMMICWDTAHPALWQKYAGKVDAMLIMSCPPKLSSPDIVFPDGRRVNTGELNGLMAEFYTEEEYFPGKDMDEHAAWMGVPVMQAVGGGKISTRLPKPFLSLTPYLTSRPDLLAYLPQVDNIRFEAGFDKQTKILNARGEVQARVTDDGDSFTIAEITLADTLPEPTEPQPPMRTHPLTYFLGDVFGPSLLASNYRRGIRARWGEDMAPVDLRTRIQLITFIVLTVMLFWLMRHNKKNHNNLNNEA